MNNITRYKSILINGIEIFYREAGREDNPTILLLHGFPSSSFMFRNLINELKEKYYLIAPDYPGFGYSHCPATNEFEYTFDNLSLIIEEFINKLGIKKFSLYIQDYGAPVGLRIVMHRPELLECLIIQNANAYEKGLGPLCEPLISAWKNSRESARETIYSILELPITRLQYIDGAYDLSRISPDTWHLDQALLDRPGNKEIQFQLLYDYKNNLTQYPKWQKMLRKLQPPTLIVWGERDQFFVKEGALAYGDDLSNIEFNFFPTGHFALEEFYTEIAAKIDDFLYRNLMRSAI